MGDALKSQKKGLKLDVTRMGYTGVYTEMNVQNHREVVHEALVKLREIVYGGNYRKFVRGGNYLRNGPGG